MKKDYYSYPWVYWLQKAWAWLCFLGFGFLSRKLDWSFWVSSPLCMIAGFVMAYLGIGLISLCDYNHRMCAKYNIRIEMLPLYEKTFNELAEQESRGIDTFGIPQDIQDADEWLRYCHWQTQEGIEQLKRL